MDALEERVSDEGTCREVGEADGEADPAFDIDLDPDEQGSADAGAANPD